MTKKFPVLITGATSPIAIAYAKLCAKAGHSLILAGRDVDEITITASDLKIRHQVDVEVVAYDAAIKGAGQTLAQMAVKRNISSAVVFHGAMLDQDGFAGMLQVNCASVAELFEAIIDDSEVAQQKPTLAAVSSVAGDRGRQSNYPYGATKAALDTYLSGLRNRAQPFGIHILTVKPGFVRTRLTEGKVNPRSPLLASPERIAADIFTAIKKKKNIVYTPWFWAPIMWIIRNIPEFIFKRLKL